MALNKVFANFLNRPGVPPAKPTEKTVRFFSAQAINKMEMLELRFALIRVIGVLKFNSDTAAERQQWGQLDVKKLSDQRVVEVLKMLKADIKYL